MRESLALGAMSGSIAEIKPFANVIRTFAEHEAPPSHAYCA
jgi:hypothetical protein